MEAVQAHRTPEFTNGLADPAYVHDFVSTHLGNTTHISVMDGEGRAASVTCTNGEGSGVVVPGTGIHVNNIMGEEDLSPAGFHLAPPGTRMPSMMAPTVVLRDGEVEIVLGSAGSNRIRSAILQVIVGVVDHGMAAGEAVNAPRVHFEDGIVFAEPGVPVEELSGRRSSASASATSSSVGRRRSSATPTPARSAARRPAARRGRGGGVRRGRCALAALACAAAACGTPSADLFVVDRDGSLPGAKLTLRVGDGGTVRCDGGDERPISSDDLLDARQLAEDLAPLLDRRVTLAAKPGSQLRFRVTGGEGEVRFADNSPRPPRAFGELIAFTRRIAMSACGRPR